MGRLANADSILPTGGGPDGKSPVFVPKGNFVVGNFYGLHQDPDVYGKDIDIYNPHRWDDLKPTSMEFMAFGHGHRSCLGKEKALVEAAYILARLAQEFDGLESRNDRSYKGRIGITMKNAYGCQVAFRRRVQ